MHPIAHFKTITRHRHLVCKYCFRLGLYAQGLAQSITVISALERQYLAPSCSNIKSSSHCGNVTLSCIISDNLNLESHKRFHSIQ